MTLRCLSLTASPIWALPPTNLTLASDAVHVWYGSLDLEPGRQRAMEYLLAPDECDRAARYRFDRHRRQYVAGRGMLRLMLSRYLRREPESITFAYGVQGKPTVASVEFNVSHAGGRVLLAVSRSRRVGVDIEPIRILPDADRMVHRFFSASEIAAYAELPNEERPEAFATCWTRKEAFIKAIGSGLSYPLDAFDVTIHPDEPARLRAIRTGSAEAWHMEALPVGPGYAATVIAEHPPWHMHCWDAASLPVPADAASCLS